MAKSYTVIDSNHFSTIAFIWGLDPESRQIHLCQQVEKNTFNKSVS